MFPTQLLTLLDKLRKIEQIEPYSSDGDELDNELVGRSDTAAIIADRITHIPVGGDWEPATHKLLEYVKRLRDEHICGSCNLWDDEREEIWGQKLLAREIVVDLERILEPQMKLFTE